MGGDAFQHLTVTKVIFLSFHPPAQNLSVSCLTDLSPNSSLWCSGSPITLFQHIIIILSPYTPCIPLHCSLPIVLSNSKHSASMPTLVRLLLWRMPSSWGQPPTQAPSPPLHTSLVPLRHVFSSHRALYCVPGWQIRIRSLDDDHSVFLPESGLTHHLSPPSTFSLLTSPNIVAGAFYEHIRGKWDSLL